jgi:hypothetical protein
MEMCRKELPTRQLKSFDFKSARQIYDTGKFTIAGNPSADGREAQLWALDPDGRVSMTATAKSHSKNRKRDINQRTRNTKFGGGIQTYTPTLRLCVCCGQLSLLPWTTAPNQHQ